MKALITGISGQDAFFLEKELRSRYPDIKILGLYRGQDELRLDSLKQDMPGVEFVRGDITDVSCMYSLIGGEKPDMIFNLAAVTSVPLSIRMPYLTTRINIEGVVNILEAIRLYSPETRFFQASTSEMFGNANPAGSLAENARMEPTSPYGISKLAAHLLTKNYREGYGLFACAAISFNHESELRPPIFVTRKVTQAVARIKAGKQSLLELGNLHARRDWGYAGDYVGAFVTMLEQDAPDDYVIGTGQTHSISELVDYAFNCAGGLDRSHHVVVTASNMRPVDNNYLCADPRKAKEQLGWEAKTSFKELISLMVEHDLKLEGIA